MPQIDDALSVTGEGVIVTIEVSPGSRQNRFPAGFNPWRKTILCRVTAPAQDGKANTAVLSLISESLGIPAGAIRIRSGATSSVKKILIEGLTKEHLVQQIVSLM